MILRVEGAGEEVFIHKKGKKAQKAGVRQRGAGFYKQIFINDFYYHHDGQRSVQAKVRVCAGGVRAGAGAAGVHRESCGLQWGAGVGGGD
jgi:hypothetical protein